MRTATARARRRAPILFLRSEEHTSELQSLRHLVCRLLLEKKKTDNRQRRNAENNPQRIHTRRASGRTTLHNGKTIGGASQPNTVVQAPNIAHKRTSECPSS